MTDEDKLAHRAESARMLRELAERIESADEDISYAFAILDKPSGRAVARHGGFADTGYRAELIRCLAALTGDLALRICAAESDPEPGETVQ